MVGDVRYSDSAGLPCARSRGAHLSSGHVDPWFAMYVCHGDQESESVTMWFCVVLTFLQYLTHVRSYNI